MSSKTKIVVFKMKELIYTGLFLALAALLILFLVIMFRGRDSAETGASADSRSVLYQPGIYSASLVLGEKNLEVSVSVDEEHINSVRFVNLDESVAAMYPLMESSMANLAEQILTNQSTEGLTMPDDARYTSLAILDAVNRALAKAVKSD